MFCVSRSILLLLLLLMTFAALGAQELIYTEEFSSALPTGWALTNIGANGWNPSVTYLPYSGTYCMRYDGNYWDPANAWAFTQGIEMTAGNSYYVEFYQAVSSSYYHESMKLTVGTAQTVQAQSTTLIDLPDLVNGNYINRVSNTFTQRFPHLLFCLPLLFCSPPCTA